MSARNRGTTSCGTRAFSAVLPEGAGARDVPSLLLLKTTGHGRLEKSIMTGGTRLRQGGGRRAITNGVIASPVPALGNKPAAFPRRFTERAARPRVGGPYRRSRRRAAAARPLLGVPPAAASGTAHRSCAT